jgi:putative oxidoreductase
MVLHKLMHNPVTAWLRKPENMDCAHLIMRLAVGGIFLNHGLMKFKAGMPMITNFFGGLGIPMPGLMAPFISSLETFGGILMILGLGTRLFGALFAATMFTAIATAFKWKFADAELESLLLASSLALMLMGGGKYSLDALCMKKGKGEHDAALPMAAPKA